MTTNVWHPLSSERMHSRRAPFAPARVRAYAARAAGFILRYGVVLLLLGYGALKFTALEAKGIAPLIAHSPLMAWLYDVASQQAVSNFIGVVEIVLALGMAARPWAPLACALGSLGATAMFAVTLSFLVTTPEIWLSVPGFILPVPNDLGGFILKDLMLLGASLWSFAEALSARSGEDASRKDTLR